MDRHRPDSTGRPSGPRAVLIRHGLVLAVVALGLAPTSSRAASKPEAGDNWPEITKEERSLTKVPQDPEADAVVLLNERSGKIVPKGNDWVNIVNYQWRLKVLTARGKEYGEIHIRAEKYSRVSNLQARTVKPDGTIVPVAPDQVFEKVVLQIGDYKVTEKVFNFPAVEPGAILEYRYERYDNFLLYIDPWFFEGPEFTMRSKVTQMIPMGMGYTILCDLCPSVKPTISDWREGKDKGQLYSMELRDLPGYHDGALMPPRREASPHLEMVLQAWKDRYWDPLGRQDRLFTDWNSVAQYADFFYAKAIKDGQDAMKPIVEGWVQGLSDPQEKVKAIVRHVQNDFRYVPFVSVIGRTSSVASILKEKRADN